MSPLSIIVLACSAVVVATVVVCAIGTIIRGILDNRR